MGSWFCSPGSQSLSREREHGIRDGGRHRRNRGFSQSRGRVGTRNEVNFESGNLRHAEQTILAKISLGHSSPLHRDLAVQRGLQRIEHRALNLSGCPARIHHQAAIDCRDQPVHPDSPLRQ